MKRILLLASIAFGVAVACPATTTAQVADRYIAAVDSTLNTDTGAIVFQAVPAIKAIQATVTKISGTVAGKVYLQGTIDGNWISLDSLTNSNQATNSKLFPLSETYYYSYRLYYTTSGTQASILKGSYLRRPEE